MICSACQQENEPAYRVCSRCGARAIRDVSASLILGSLLTRDIIWGINLAGLAIPLALLAGGVWAAVFVWDRAGFLNYWSIFGFAMLIPGVVFSLSLFPAFRRVQSMLFGLGVFVMFGLLAGGAGGLFFALYLFNSSYGWSRFLRRTLSVLWPPQMTPRYDGDIIIYRLSSRPITPPKAW